MKKYIQVKAGYITDCISFPFEDYIEVEHKDPINISGFMIYKDGVIGIDEKKKAEIEEAQRLAEEEYEREIAEGNKKEDKNGILKQVKNMEEEAKEKRIEYITAQMIEDEELRDAKLKKIDKEGKVIAEKWNALIKVLRDEFGYDTKSLLLDLSKY